ncbi:MAG: hypothetical protein JXR25_15700 [Pontiellaceae bacterium]|nr:hypothetical protein [Pontiellaceae bacterium]MBN2786265.1 hypothetical protein [Pontiellaceae bacterium]
MRKQTIRRIATNLIFTGLVTCTNSVLAGLTVTTSNENGAAPFTPSWTVNQAGSLIHGLVPSSINGDFNLEEPEIGARDVNSLTSNTDLTPTLVLATGGFNTTSPNYVTVGNGSGAGRVLVYTLPASANGYNLANITVYGGWADNGRDALAHTILYSTVEDPDSFIVLTAVEYNPSISGGTPTANRAVIADSAGGAIAENVAAIKFVFDVPAVENGFAGLAAITVSGEAAGSVATPRLAISTATETGENPYSNTWTVNPNNLIAELSPSSAPGNFSQESSGGTYVLTDGEMANSGEVYMFATCGSGGGNSIEYDLPSTGNGIDVTNITVYSGWGDGGRDGQYYTVSYATIGSPLSFVPITTVYLNPVDTTGAVANRVEISMNDGSSLGSGIAKLKFDFSSPPGAGSFDNAYCGIGEIEVEGFNSAEPPPPPSPLLLQDVLPSYAETMVGDEMVFEVEFSNTPPASLQWLHISDGVTNVISGATGATLTLSNVQADDAGLYLVKAVNAENSEAAPFYTSQRELVVSSVPAAVNNVIMKTAAQSGMGPVSSVNQSTNFYPTWSVDTSDDLILGFETTYWPETGTALAGDGDFGLDQASGDPTVLVDGTLGYVTYWPNVGSSTSLVTCGNSPAGQSMTYYLDDTAAYGWDLTNVVVYGGWGDSGRNEQKYEILYSTYSAPSNFVSMGTFVCNPENPGGYQSASRVQLIPEVDALAGNVVAVKFDWNIIGAGPKNGYEGYSEIIINGTPAAPKPTLVQNVMLTAKDVVGSTLTLSAIFDGADSYQWQKDGVDIPGANSATLTLSNLQLSDSSSAGGYRLIASNGAGSTTTRGCAVTVNPAPSAVDDIVIAIAHQASDAVIFEPSWDVGSFPDSLIYQASPIDAEGSFDLELSGGTNVLTDAGYGQIVSSGHPAFATCGPSAGNYVVYELPSASGFGCDITNIVIASGWNDSGRDDLWCTVSYSTVMNPSSFLPIAAITSKPDGVSGKSVTQATLTSSADNILAGNVYAIKVDFTTPSGVENGYVGISQINVFGEDSLQVAEPYMVMSENQNTNIPNWVVETSNLIGGTTPGATGEGDFDGDFNNEPVCGGLAALTDGGFSSATNYLDYATCGGSLAGSSVTYTAPEGTVWNLTNIVVYSGWGNYNRDGQFYNIYYTTWDEPDTAKLLVPVRYNPPAGSGPSVNRVQIAPNSWYSELATNVYTVTFDFTPQTSDSDNGYSGYAEIILQGTTSSSARMLPTVSTSYVSEGSLIVSGSGGTPGAGYTWMTTTNLQSSGSWTTYSTGTLDGNGSFSDAMPIDTSDPVRFFRMSMP